MEPVFADGLTTLLIGFFFNLWVNSVQVLHDLIGSDHLPRIANFSLLIFTKLNIYKKNDNKNTQIITIL